MKKGYFVVVVLVVMVARVQGQAASDAAISAAASAIQAIADAGGAVHRGAATLVDGSRAASDVGRSAIETIAELLQVPPVGGGGGGSLSQPPPQGRGGRFFQSIFSGK